MVADWSEAFANGEDALMVAKRNAEVQQLNELARAAMREQGRLGDIAIQIGENMFAAGDQAITRVNDHANQIYNRERWTVAKVDAEARSVVLDGIDTGRRVCVDAVYLERVNPRDEAPALRPPGAEARLRAGAIEAVLAERRTLAIAAVRISPPTYIKAELGGRPSDPQKRKAWDRAVAGIEGHRQEYGGKDRERALGAKPKDWIERSDWNSQRRRPAESQRALGLEAKSQRDRQIAAVARLLRRAARSQEGSGNGGTER